MPSQDNENAMDGLLRRSLARDSTARGDCPDAELLAAYFDQALGADEAVGYELHFSTCPRCREQLAAMARATTEQITQPDHSLEPVFASAGSSRAVVLDSARAADHAKPVPVSVGPSESKSAPLKSPGAKWLDIRWLIPVVAVLILATVSAIHFASRTKNLGLNNQVAISKPSVPPQDQGANETDKKLESSESQKTAPLEAKQAPPPIAKTKSAPRSAPAPSAPPAHAPAQPAASAGAAVSGGDGGTGGGIPSYRGRSGGTVYGGRAGVVRPSIPGAAKTTTGSHFSSGARGNVSSAPARQVESNSAQRVVPDENSTASQNSAADQNAAQSAPAAPAPELNASLPPIIVATSSADAVKSPAPAPPAGAATKSQAFGLNGRNLHTSTAGKSAAKAKPAQEGYTETVIPTSDSDLFYRIAGGGFVEISEDGGATWQRQLLNPSAEFTAGSAPEPRICWLVGRSGIVFLTEDGKSWRKLPSPTSEDLVVVLAKSASNATVTANDNQRWSTDDAGKNWHPVK
jgi:hypothetical protein